MRSKKEKISHKELKSVEKMQKVYAKQLLTYLKLANKQLGLLINFNVVLLKEGISRIINAPQGLGFYYKK